jgi:hypothetical protein
VAVGTAGQMKTLEASSTVAERNTDFEIVKEGKGKWQIKSDGEIRIAKVEESMLMEVGVGRS